MSSLSIYPNDPNSRGGVVILDESRFEVDFISMDEWARIIDINNEEKGWNAERNESEWAALAHSEISEAYEEYRKGADPHATYLSEGGKPEGMAIEYADALIRILHWFARHNLQPNRVVAMKMAYNTTRPFRHGGKVT